MEQALAPTLDEHDPAHVEATVRREPSGRIPEQLTFYGIALFVIGSTIMLSASSSFRPTIAGLSLHPCQFPLILIVPILFLTRLNHFPSAALFWIVVFAGIYCAASL